MFKPANLAQPANDASTSRRDVMVGGADFLVAVAGLSLLAEQARAAGASRPHRWLRPLPNEWTFGVHTCFADPKNVRGRGGWPR